MIRVVLLNLAVLAGIVAVFWLLRPRPEVRLVVRDGEVGVARGKVSRRFQAELARSHRVVPLPDGVIDGRRGGDGRMRFEFPPAWSLGHEQRFRNLWNLYGEVR